MNKRIKFIAEVSIMVALGVVLDFIAKLTNFMFPAGGSLSFAMIVIFIMGYRYGVIGSLITGLLLGVIQTFYGASFYHPIQIFLDYYGGYALVGLSGLFFNLIKNESLNKKKCLYISLSVMLGTLFRLICSFLSGVIFFSEWADPVLGPYWYSLLYNISYLVPSSLLCLVLLILFVYKAPKLLEPQKDNNKLTFNQIASISISSISIMMFVLFTGNMFIKGTPFSEKYSLYYFIFKLPLAIEDVTIGGIFNIFALLSLILFVIILVVAIIPLKPNIKFLIITISSVLSFISLLVFRYDVENSIVAITTNQIVFNYPYYLALTISLIFVILNTIITILSYKKKHYLFK